MPQILKQVGKSIALLLMAGAISGCGSDPSSEPGRPLSQHDADRQYRGRLLVLVDGKTTRGDVLTVMGEPDNVSADGRSVLYDWTVKDRQDGQLRRTLVLAAFDGAGVLIRHKTIEEAEKFGGMTVPGEALATFAQQSR